MEVGRAIGEEVVIISTSMGGTLVAAGLDREPLMEKVKGVVFASPNFKIKNWQAELGKLAFFDKWGPIIGGSMRSWDPVSELHGEFWTTRYPTKSIVPMMALIDYVEDLNFSKTSLPSLFILSKLDQVVDTAATEQVIENWGGRTRAFYPELTQDDDPYAHVIAGDAFSPNQNELVKISIVEFINQL